METRQLQVASSFTSIPIAKTLRLFVVNAGIADELGSSQYSQMAEYRIMVINRLDDMPELPKGPNQEDLASSASDYHKSRLTNR